MSHIRKILLSMVCFVGMVIGVSAYAAKGVVGYWQTIDHDTNKPSSLIYIWKSKGKYFGKIAKVYQENGHKKKDRCVKCTGSRRNKPMLGLEIIRNMVAQRDEWTDGTILDPTNGKDYHAKMWLEKGERELHVRGYIGIPLFGRTDVWYRYK